MNFNEHYLEAAHEHCFSNEVEVRDSESACCIACAVPFPARLATEVIRQLGDDNRTVFCPVCALDTVIGDCSGLPVNDPAFIVAMNRRFQNEPLGSEESWKEFLNASNQ